MPKRRKRRINTHSKFSTYLRRPSVQIGTLLVIALIVVLIALAGRGENTSAPAAEISVDQAYQLYQEGTFVLDVRTQEEWNEYHAPNTTLIPLEQLQSRLNELPKDRQIVVVCRSGNRSQEGRDILLSAGFQAISMAGGLKEWSAQGYPIEGTRP
jgi:rhodanese-related sulfurtransferase